MSLSNQDLPEGENRPLLNGSPSERLPVQSLTLRERVRILLAKTNPFGYQWRSYIVLYLANAIVGFGVGFTGLPRMLIYQDIMCFDLPPSRCITEEAKRTDNDVFKGVITIQGRLYSATALWGTFLPRKFERDRSQALQRNICLINNV